MIHFYSVWRGISNDQLLEMLENDGFKSLPMVAVDVKLVNEEILIGKPSRVGDPQSKLVRDFRNIRMAHAVLEFLKSRSNLDRLSRFWSMSVLLRVGSGFLTFQFLFGPDFLVRSWLVQSWLAGLSLDQSGPSLINWFPDYRCKIHRTQGKPPKTHFKTATWDNSRVFQKFCHREAFFMLCSSWLWDRIILSLRLAVVHPNRLIKFLLVEKLKQISNIKIVQCQIYFLVVFGLFWIAMTPTKNAYLQAARD